MVATKAAKWETYIEFWAVQYGAPDGKFIFSPLFLIILEGTDQKLS